MKTNTDKTEENNSLKAETKKPYKPGLLRDVDKELVEKLSNEEKIKFTIDGYDRVASDWDKTRQNFWPELILEINKYIETPLRGASEDNKLKILDLGCGNGRLIKKLESYNIDYTGIDPSIKLIEIAKEKYPESEYPNIKLKTFDGLTLNNKSAVNSENNIDFTDESFDQVISIAVLHHIPKDLLTDWLKEVHRVLKSETTSIFTTWNLSESNYDLNRKGEAVIGFVHHKNTRYVKYYSYEEIREVFEKAGFEIIEIKDIKRDSGMSNTVIIVKKNKTLLTLSL